MESGKSMPMPDNGANVNFMQNNPAPPPYYAAPPQPVQMQPQTVAFVPTGGVAVVSMGPRMGTAPSSFTCPSCRAVIITRTEAKVTMKTHLFALVLCLIGCWPCACIPYCTDSCQNIDHYCPECNAYIGSSYN